MGRLSPDLLDLTRFGFSVEIATRYADLDPAGHINNVAMAAAFEDARLRFDVAVARLAMGRGRRVVVAAAHIDYLAEARYPAPLEVYLAVLEIGRSSWSVGELALQAGAPRAFCRATLVYIEDERPAPLPETFRARLERQRLKPTSPPNSPVRSL